MTQVALDSASAVNTEVKPKPVRITAGERAGIPPRRMDFEFDKESKYWFKNSPFLTMALSALSTTFPAGETFFVDSVKNYRSEIKDQKLKDEVTGFIGQEALHSKEHEAFDRYLEEQGLPGHMLEKWCEGAMWLLRKLPKKMQLAATCGMEHYTATYAEYFLRTPAVTDLFTDDEVKKLWMWHALEENEHKAVAFDVYQDVAGGGYFTRSLGMILGTITLFGLVFMGHTYLLYKEKKLFNIKDNLSSIWWAFGFNGYITGRIGKVMDYFRPGFHPNDHDTDQLLKDCKKDFFTEGGLLFDQIKNPSATNMA